MNTWLSYRKYTAYGVIILLAVLPGLVWLTASDKQDEIYPPQGYGINKAFSYITGLSYKIYGSGGVESHLEADSYSVVPRRFLFFNLYSINEVRIKDVRIKHYLDSDSSERLEIVPLVIMPVSFGSEDKRGMPTRGVIEGLVLEMFRSGKPVLLLHAEEALIDKKLNTSFINARLESKATGKRIVSKEIIWKRNDTMFSIPGRYYAKTPKGKASGKGIRVDLDFNVSLL